MACMCKDVDGNPSPFCVGCNSNKILNPEYQYRNQEDSFTQKQCEQFRKMIKHELCNAPMLDQIWIDGFLKGFEHGRES